MGRPERQPDPEALGAEVAAARVDVQQGRPARAAVRLRAMRGRLPRDADSPLDLLVPRARMNLTLAAAEYDLTGRLDAAMALLAEAEELAAMSRSDALLASVRGQRGLLLLRGGQVREALAALDAAVEVIDPADPADQMSILLNRGTAQMEKGSLDIARADLERCVEVAMHEGDRDHELRARHNIGYVEFLAGRIPRALAAMDRAEALNTGAPHPISLLDQARVLREAGLTTDAERLLARAADLFAEHRLAQDLGETRLAMAECALVESHADRARDLARRAQRAFARRGNQLWERKAQMLVLRSERRLADERPAAPGRLRSLAGRARDLAEACTDEGRPDLARSARLLAVECELRAGTDPDLAAPQLPAVRSTDPLPARLQSREVRALAAMRRGQRGRAASEIRRGLGELGSRVNRYGSLDLRTATAVHGVSLARIGLDLAEAGGRPSELFAAIERGRAFSTRLAPVGPPTDGRTAELLGELRRCEEGARGLEGDATAAEELVRRRVEAGRLQRDIRARSWEVEGGAEPVGRPSARVGEVREASRAAGTAFVSYVAHRGRWLAVLASGRRAQVFDLVDVAEVEELARRLRADLDALALPHLPAPLVDAVRRSLDVGLGRLDDLLVGPLGIEGSPVVVSCSSALTQLPWSLMPSRRGLSCVLTPSATAWLRAGPASRSARPRVVVVAGPGLHRAEDEAARVQALWPRAELLTGATATTAAGRAALADADVVHVAAHGTHEQESPLFSSLRLSDGPLYAYELDARGGSAPCVALSACEAGLATVRPGDEGLGLTSVLLHLGTRSVLAGVARVRDDVAARVMEDVHREMAGGAESADALARAVAAEPEHAPFVAFGAAW